MKRIYLCVILILLCFCSVPICLRPLRLYGVYPKPKRIQRPTGDNREPSFGVEFTADRLFASVTLGNESTYSLAVVPGDSEYKSLMRKYLETCRQAYLTQKPPSDHSDLQTTSTRGREEEYARRERYIRRPEHSWRDNLMVWFLNKPLYSPGVFEGDEYQQDLEAKIVTNAVRNLRREMTEGMFRLFNTTEPRLWGFASIVVPNFFFTTVATEPDLSIDDVNIDWSRGLQAIWLRDTLRKFSVALYRNKFRLDEPSDWQGILDSYDRMLATPTSFQSLSHTRKHHCIREVMSAELDNQTCDARTLSPTSIVIDYNNDSLSLWVEGPQTLWTPWNTFSELGDHNVVDQQKRGDELLDHWDRAAGKLATLTDSLSPSDKGAVDLVFTGQCWTDGHVDMFKNALKAQRVKEQIQIVNEVHQSDTFAASKRAARWGRYDLDTWDLCYQFVKDIAHDEL